MGRLELIALNLAAIQVEIRRRRYFVRRRWQGREFAVFDHGWGQKATCPRCYFLMDRGSLTCFQCAVELRGKQPHQFLIVDTCYWHHEWERCGVCGLPDKPDDPTLPEHLRHSDEAERERMRQHPDYSWRDIYSEGHVVP